MAGSKKTHSKTGELQNYFQNSALDQELNISSNGQLKFHWANWSKTCLLQKSNVSEDTSKIDLLNEGLELLKSYPIWYQRNLVTIKSNLYELYTSYLDPRLKMTWHDIQKETMVSLQHEAGPYISLTSMRWMDKETYSLFIFRKLLTGHHPMRDFRISSDIEVTGDVNHSPLSKIDMKITQFTKKGFIIAINGHNFDKVKNCNDIKVPLSLDIFSKLKNRKDINHFKVNQDVKNQYINIHGASIRRFGNLDNASFSNGAEYFFFIPYSEVEVVGHTENAHKLFSHFVELIEELFETELSTKTVDALKAA